MPDVIVIVRRCDQQNPVPHGELVALFLNYNHDSAFVQFHLDFASRSDRTALFNRLSGDSSQTGFIALDLYIGNFLFQVSCRYLDHRESTIHQ